MMLAHSGIEYDDEAIWGVEFQRRKVSGEFPWDRLPMTVRVKNKARREELNNSTFLVVPLLLIIVALLSVLLPLLPSANAAYTLEHKRTLVTGASGGIGAGIAKTLAQKGARVLVHYNTRRDGAEATAQSIRDSGGICDGIIQCDFRDPSNIREMFGTLDGVWGEGVGPDVLINNAGVIPKRAVEDEEDGLGVWMETMQVNLNAPYQLSKLAHQRMKGGGNGGVIINVSSIHASISVEYMTAYAASKAGLDRLTAGLASEWADDNIRVNAVAPGVVPVERTEALMAKKEVQDLWLPHLPVGRMGTVEEVAHSVVYLCENEWTTGTILTIDGGMTGRANMPFRPRPEKPKSDDTCL